MTHQRILANVRRDEFVGRDAELREIVHEASRPTDRHGLVVLAASGVGAGELLRQAYDELFLRRGAPIPIHFEFRRSDGTRVEAARRFFHTFLQQYVAYRRVDPSLCSAPLTSNDLAELALPGDYELVTELLENFERERANSDQREFVRFCLNAPYRLTASGRRLYHLLDCLDLATPWKDESVLEQEIAAAVSRSSGPFTLAGLRRQVVDLFHGAGDGREAGDFIHLEKLS